MEQMLALNAAGIFLFGIETKAFEAAFTKALAKEVHSITSHRLSERNTHRYNHGRSWQHHADDAREAGSMETHSAQMMIKFEDVVLSDDTLILRQLEEAAEAFHRQFMMMMYRTISDCCDRTGNVVSQADHGNFPEAFLHALRTIEFGVDCNGDISMPEIHLDTKTFEKVIPELEAQPQSFRDEVDALTKTKKDEALEREAERLARFRSAA